MFHKIGLYYRTVRYLKPRQVGFRVYYMFRRKFYSVIGYRYPQSIPSNSVELKLQPSIPAYYSYLGNNTFQFLNLEKGFENSIDWNYADYGKLWTYNLNYFDFLHQPGIDKATGWSLIRDFISNSNYLKDGLEPYPISLRGINWIKFFTRHHINDQKTNDHLYAQYYRLLKNPEYHLMGNHLLENGCSLLFGAYYFNDKKLYDKAAKIIKSELEEQILEDGGHFERSPMYHQIILFRLLECLNLAKNNDLFDHELESLLIDTCKKMIRWLNAITFTNGDIPLVNDSASGIAPITEQINAYARRLLNTESTEKEKITTKNSKEHKEKNDNNSLCSFASFVVKNGTGYRKMVGDDYEMVIDVGDIGPDYIPGHAHSDTFSFVLHIHGQPVIVDTGVSTYEKNQQRLMERSTAAHNTVMVEDKEQSEVWSGFRVGKRAKIVNLREKDGFIQASHNGYKSLGITHERKWTYDLNEIHIEDIIHGSSKKSAPAFLHFHPSVNLSIDKNKINVNKSTFLVNGYESIEKKSYTYALGFNKLVKADYLIIRFKNHLHTVIQP